MATTTEQPVPRTGRAKPYRLIAWGVLAAWVIAVVALVPLAGSLHDAQSDKPVDYLPASADSTKVAKLVDTLPGGGEDAYIVAYVRDAGITAADRAAVAAQLEKIRAKYPDTTKASAGKTGGVTASADGTALMVTLPISAAAGAPEDVVIDVRAMIADRPDGLQAWVTGPPAVSGDMDAVFGGVDATLMLATLLVVTVLLILTYRSPVLWLLPLVAVGTAAVLAMALVYELIKIFGLTVNTQSASILTVLVIGAGTDYALLLTARYREELRRCDSVGEAMARAWRASAPAIVASGGTVILALLCLLLADLNNTRSLGPVGAAGIAAALLAMLTLFPALLVVCGRPVFWPTVPRPGDTHRAGGRTHAVWESLGTWIDGHRVRALAGSLVVLGVLALGLFTGGGPLREQDQFLKTPESVAGFGVLGDHFPEFGGQPMTILTRPAVREQVLATVQHSPGITEAVTGRVGQDWAEITAFPADAPDTPAEGATIRAVRTAVHAVPGADAIVGGPSAENLDQSATSQRDRNVVIPAVLLVVLIVLALLLRAIVAPVVLVATVVVSFTAALGASYFLFEHLFGFKGVDHQVILLGFLFLVALGVDYNIFLMTRAREETRLFGTRLGLLRALATTGGVITSAGLVLAATFAVLATLPLVMMIELGFLVALGILIDTFLVRSVLVPAAVLTIGRRVWWPSRLAQPGLGDDLPWEVEENLEQQPQGSS